jgi:N-acetylglutamate synthase
MNTSPIHIEGIERATLASVPPRELMEDAGWLLPFDDGRIGRAKAWVPLAHDGAAEAACIARFDEWLGLCKARDQVAALRLPENGMPNLKAFLTARGMAARDEAIDVRVAPVDAALAAGRSIVRGALPAGWTVELATRPSPRWGHVFLGPGFDATEGASRIEILSRAQAAVYATAIDAKGEPLACGTCVRHTHAGLAWAGIHGMRTLASARRQGLAARLMRELLQSAAEQGATWAFLQVESANAPAIALYERLGFACAWKYWYWRFDGPRGY